MFMLTGRKMALTLAFTVLVALAFGAGCRGFFPKEHCLVCCDPASESTSTDIGA